MNECQHKNFASQVNVTRLEGCNRFQADIRIFCDACDTSFLFVGLPPGINLNGAAVSFDRKEARMAIVPERIGVHPPREFSGYHVKESYE